MDNQWISNDEDENVSQWGETNTHVEKISEWLVDDEPPMTVDNGPETINVVNNRNVFLETYKIEINSIFDGPKLFHQEHINKKKSQE